MRSKAKKIIDNTWVEGFYVESSRQAFIHDDGGNIWRVAPESRCRDTGLRSAQGKPIWENDRVFFEGYVGTVRFGLYNDKHYGYFIFWENDYILRKDIWYWSKKAVFGVD